MALTHSTVLLFRVRRAAARLRRQSSGRHPAPSPCACLLVTSHTPRVARRSRGARMDGARGRAKALFRASLASIWRYCCPQRRPACCAVRRIVVDVLASSRLPTILPLLAPVEFAVAAYCRCSGRLASMARAAPTPSSGLLRPPSRAPLCALNGCRPHPSGRRSNKDHALQAGGAE